MKQRLWSSQSIFIGVVMFCSILAEAQTENWPRWRGPRNDGTSTETGVAARWSKTENVKWRLELPGPAPSTPIVWQDKIFLTSAGGSSLALMSVNTFGKILWKHAKTGKEFYLERTHNQRHRASPVYADGKIYLTATDGMVTVVKAGKQFEVIAQNTIAERLSASPAISGGTIYLRSYKALYAIGGK